MTDSCESVSMLSSEDFDEVFEDIQTNHFDNQIDDVPPQGGQVLSRSDLEHKIEKMVNTISQPTSLSAEDSEHLLWKFKWDTERALQDYFNDQQQVCREVGIFQADEGPSSSNHTCTICFDQYPPDEMRSCRCNHSFCKECWLEYIRGAVSTLGRYAIDLRCPHRGSNNKHGKQAVISCGAYVPMELFNDLLGSSEDKNDQQLLQQLKQQRLLMLVGEHPRMTWCVGRDCEFAIQVGDAPNVKQGVDVQCRCGTNFCFNCKEEAHKPVICSTVRKWMIKNQSESENVHYILVHTKPCPACGANIEKNQGCNHMQCTVCQHSFCWLCLQPWDTHGERTGGYYACNKFDEMQRKGDRNEETEVRQRAAKSLERYTHYYERYTSNEKAKVKALEQLNTQIRPQVSSLAENLSVSCMELQCIIDAWQQVIDCRRVLQWTYAYGYYEFEDALQSDQRKKLFEFQQGYAEVSLERLHFALERGPLKDADGISTLKVGRNFEEFRSQLMGLKDTTNKYFQNMVEALEKQLANNGFVEEAEGQPLSSPPHNPSDDAPCPASPAQPPKTEPPHPHATRNTAQVVSESVVRGPPPLPLIDNSNTMERRTRRRLNQDEREAELAHLAHQLDQLRSRQARGALLRKSLVLGESQLNHGDSLECPTRQPHQQAHLEPMKSAVQTGDRGEGDVGRLRRGLSSAMPSVQCGRVGSGDGVCCKCGREVATHHECCASCGHHRGRL